MCVWVWVWVVRLYSSSVSMCSQLDYFIGHTSRSIACFYGNQVHHNQLYIARSGPGWHQVSRWIVWGMFQCALEREASGGLFCPAWQSTLGGRYSWHSCVHSQTKRAHQLSSCSSARDWVSSALSGLGWVGSNRGR